MKINIKKMFSNYCEAFDGYSKMMAAYYKSNATSEITKLKK